MCISTHNNCFFWFFFLKNRCLGPLVLDAEVVVLLSDCCTRHGRLYKMTEVWQLEKPRKRRLYVTDTSAPVEVIGQVVHVRKRSPRLVFVDLMMRCDSVSSPPPHPSTLLFLSHTCNWSQHHTTPHHTTPHYITYSSVLSICATVLIPIFCRQC